MLDEIFIIKKLTCIQKITPFLWFNDNAEKTAKYYTSIFKNSEMRIITRYGDTGLDQEVSWQIIPSVPGKLMNDRGKRNLNNVMQSMLKMYKLQIKVLEEAHHNRHSAPS